MKGNNITCGEGHDGDDGFAIFSLHNLSLSCVFLRVFGVGEVESKILMRTRGILD